MDKCEDCKYFVPKNPKDVEGPCFRHPPRILTSNPRGTSVRCFHPTTNRNGFCGEFVPKELDEKGSSDDSQETKQSGKSEGFEDDGSSRTTTKAFQAESQENHQTQTEDHEEGHEEN